MPGTKTSFPKEFGVTGSLVSGSHSPSALSTELNSVEKFSLLESEPFILLPQNFRFSFFYYPVFRLRVFNFSFIVAVV